MFSFCAQKACLEVDSINGGGDDEDLGFGKITEIVLYRQDGGMFSDITNDSNDLSICVYVGDKCQRLRQHCAWGVS